MNTPLSPKTPSRRLVILLLCLVLVLGAFLRLYELGASGVGNMYYAATVQSMVLSGKNFFFAAFEPGGSVSVDKPPLGFWVQALFAAVLGVNGFSLALPNALAGILSIGLVYRLVQQAFGPWPGLFSALALALMPITIATERNNTIDGLLVMVLLLAAWAFLTAAKKGSLGWLLCGAFLVGVGFNIKMLQAFLPLPAFFAVYFFGKTPGWMRKIAHLTLAGLLLLVVSFSWAAVVDLTPAESRPYVDNTSSNSVFELIFGHNGLSRLARGLGRSTPALPSDAVPGQPPNQVLPGQRPPGNGQPGLPGGVLPPGAAPPGLPGGMPTSPQSGAPGSMDFGVPGTLRLFTQPLADEASWLLIFALGGAAWVGLLLWKQPWDEKGLSLVLWAGWLLPELVYFTYSNGIMHAYYLVMAGPPIAALAGAAVWAAWQTISGNRVVGWAAIGLLTLAALVVQMIILNGLERQPVWALALAGIFMLAGLGLVLASKVRPWTAPLALGLWLVAMLFIPGWWSFLTTFNPAPNAALPSAGDVSNGARPAGNLGLPQGGAPNRWQNQGPLVQYLLDNTPAGTYLVATGSANEAAPFILQTRRPVLALGGFSGQTNVIGIEKFSALVASGQLRFVLSNGVDRHPQIRRWVEQNCRPVRGFALPQPGPSAPGQPGSTPSLLDCAP